MNAKLFFGFLSIVILAYLYLIYNPILIEPSEPSYVNQHKAKYRKGEPIKVFETFNFDKDSWKVCVLLKDRTTISSKIPYGKYLVTTERKTIQKMKDLSFVYTGTDMATIENEILFYKNNELVFRSEIALDDKLSGFQNADWGWIEENGSAMISILAEFEPSFLPFIYL